MQRSFHAAVAPYCCMNLSNANTDKNQLFLLLLWIFTAPPAAEEIVTKFLPISKYHTWEGSKHNQGCFGTLCLALSDPRLKIVHVAWPGTCFSSNLSDVIDTIILTIQWQVQFQGE